jgi:excisionase family DNA binding protein
METNLLRVGEVADRLSLGKSTVYIMIKDGILPVVRIGGAVRVPEAALAAWIRGRTEEPRGEARNAR